MTLGMRNSNAKFIDFGFLSGMIPGKNILPTNLDMVVCKDGKKFLVCEWKHHNEPMLFGQKIVLKGLAAQKNFTVLLIYGHSDDTRTEVNNFYQVAQNKLIYIDKGPEALKSYINTWWKLN
jgi:hypothetical protein